jgi:polyisoprenoid-binding protein YceI
VLLGPDNEGDRLVEQGLTLKGVTRPVTLELEANGFGPDPFTPDPETGARAGFTATGEIDRTAFGVSYNGVIPGGGLGLGETVKIVLEIQAALRTETAGRRD